MKPSAMVVIGVVIVAAVAVLAFKKGDSPALSTPHKAEETQRSASPSNRARLPRLLDLGADKCIPCKMMAPILEELKQEYEGRMEVEFIDVWKESEAAAHYGVRVIPTQIFFDASGKELFRHEGFYSKEDMLAKWEELGVDIEKGETNATTK